MAELKAGEVAISESQYKELISYPDKIRALEEKNSQLQSEVENKTKGIEERKTKFDEYKKQTDAEKAVLEEKLKGIEDKLGGKSIDDIVSYAKSHETTLEAQKQARIETIGKMETLLGKEFMEAKTSLFDGLDEVKKESLLKEFIEAKGLKMDTPQGNPNPTDKSQTPPGKNPLSDFEQKVASGASSKDLFKSIA